MNAIPVIILAGGMGTRLKGIVDNVPKPMADVSGKPFLEYIIRLYAGQGFRKIILSVGYKKEVIREFFGDGSRFGVNVAYSEEDSPLGTGGAVRRALDMVDGPRFTVVNGDTFNHLDLRAMEGFHNLTEAAVTLGLVYKKNTARYGFIRKDRRGAITGFAEKDGNKSGYINCGVYMMEKNACDGMPAGPFSLETDFFPKLVGKGLYGFASKGFFIDIGIAATYRYINRHADFLLISHQTSEEA